MTNYSKHGNKINAISFSFKFEFLFIQCTYDASIFYANIASSLNNT